MKYTKYQYKKKSNKSNFFMSLSITLISAAIVGIGLFYVIIYFFPIDKMGKEISIPESDDAIVENTNIDESEAVSDNASGERVFQFIQCGYFGKENNAKDTLSKIDNKYNPFILEEGDKFRVSAGIFNLEDGEKVSEELTSKGINNAKVKFVLDTSDKIQSQIAAITDGYFKIIKALEDVDAKSVNTSSFKEWTSKLPAIDDGESVDILKQYKEYIIGLNDEFKKEDIENGFKCVYGVLQKFIKK